MSNNAASRGPRPARPGTPTPSSGVRAFALPLGAATPLNGVPAIIAANERSQSGAAPRPPAPAPALGDGAAPDARVSHSRPADPPRARFDSAELTQVALPNPALLAIARGENPRKGSRFIWFALGIFVGGVGVWLAVGDVRSDLFAARVWFARILRSMHDVPPALIADENEGAEAAEANAPANIPTVDVSRLPRARPPAPPAPAATSSIIVTNPVAPPANVAPRASTSSGNANAANANAAPAAKPNAANATPSANDSPKSATANDSPKSATANDAPATAPSDDSSDAPSPTGAPTLANAPGPR
jgi:hypothetical protein